MLCCFFNTLNGILTLLGLGGIGLSISSYYGHYFFLFMLIINIGVLIFFITKAVEDPKKRKIVAWMALGFTLTNANYVYRFINHSVENKKFCKHCVNREDGCCPLECHHKKNSCGSSCATSNTHNSNTHKPIDYLSLIMNLLSFIGVIINITCFIIYYRNHRCPVRKHDHTHCDDSSCC